MSTDKMKVSSGQTVVTDRQGKAITGPHADGRKSYIAVGKLSNFIQFQTQKIF